MHLTRATPASAEYVKRAKSADEIPGLYREAAILRRVAQPGVVDLTEEHFGASEGELHFALIEGLTFDEAQFSSSQLFDCMSSLAETVAHLHDMGLAHGRLTADHVLIGLIDRRPVICGFREARPAEPGSIEMADDVAALGLLLKSKLDLPADDLRERLNVDATKVQQAAERRSTLQALAQIATDPNPAYRPSARRFADTLQLASATIKDTQPARHYRRRRELPLRNLLLAATAVVALLTAGVVATGTFSGNDSATTGQASLTTQGPEPTMTVAPTAVSEPPSASINVPTVSERANRTCPPTSPDNTAGDVNGDGCVDTVVLGNGTVDVNGEHFAVGKPDDQLAIGNWACNGLRTLALLRPSTGNLYVFSSWPGIGQEVAPELIRNVENARSLQARSGENGCDLIEVTSTNDQVTTINPITKATQ